MLHQKVVIKKIDRSNLQIQVLHYLQFQSEERLEQFIKEYEQLTKDNQITFVIE